MLAGYIRLSQEGIEPLEDFSLPIKDDTSGHCFFDDFRIALKYSFNEISLTSGVGVLIFAPNGLLWTQRSVYSYGLDEFASYYYSIDSVIDEAEKSKAKNITVLVPNKYFIKLANQENPYKLKRHNDVHNYAVDKLKRFDSYKFVYRNSYPEAVRKRLNKEAKKASLEPLFDIRGRWVNQPSRPYFNIIPDEKDERLFAEQWARMSLDYIENYFKEYEDDYGKEKTQELLKKIRNEEVKELPDVKRVRAQKKRQLKVKNYPEVKKEIICQNCDSIMEFIQCLKHFPEKKLHYYYRCEGCKASQELSEKGRVLVYGKYPKKKA